MIYAVDRFADVLKVKEVEETVPDFGGTRAPKYHYFLDEETAKAFLRTRALDAYEAAEKLMERARQRVNKVNRKFASASLPQPHAGEPK
jgi:hypothetical protein